MRADRDRGSPNILLIVADDHRRDALHGDRRSGPATPTLDRLAREGTTFTGARIAGGDNRAVCVPSRAALFTGRAPRHALANGRSKNFAESQRIAPAHIQLGERFRQEGYETHAIGKWHNDTASLNRNFGSGEALFLGGMGDHENPPLHSYDPAGQYSTGAARPTAGFSTEIFADAAIGFLRQRKPNARPFLLYLGLTSPHDPRTPPPAYRARYDEFAMQLPAGFMPQHPFDNGDLNVRDETLAAVPRDPGEIRRHLVDYYAMIEHHDHHLGRILGALEETGEYDNTLVVYVSDHGLALGAHGLMGKQNLYEPSLGVPLILAGPGVPAGRRVDCDVYSYRIFATLCALSGLPAPVSVEGASLDALWSGTSASGEPDCHFAHYFDLQRMAKDARWKLISYEVKGGSREQLFDLERDPAETIDRAADPACAAQHERLRTKLSAWWQTIAR